MSKKVYVDVDAVVSVLVKVPVKLNMILLADADAKITKVVEAFASGKFYKKGQVDEVDVTSIEFDEDEFSELVGEQVNAGNFKVESVEVTDSK